MLSFTVRKCQQKQAHPCTKCCCCVVFHFRSYGLGCFVSVLSVEVLLVKSPSLDSVLAALTADLRAQCQGPDLPKTNAVGEPTPHIYCKL
jgi:hypothetical protein